MLGANLGVDAIQEFTVLTSNYSAEYGFTSGGVINFVTKSGANTFTEPPSISSATPPFFATLSDLTNPIFPFDTNLTGGPSPPPQFNAYPTGRNPAARGYRAD